MERYTPSGIPICDGDAFGWRMENGLLGSPTHIAQRGYACGFRHGLAAGGGGGGGGGSSDTSWQQALSGETMPAKPTVSESNAALRRVWTKLGGSLATCIALCTAVFGLPGDGYVKKAQLGSLSGDEPSHVVVTNVDLGLFQYHMEQYTDGKYDDAVYIAEGLSSQAFLDSSNLVDRVAEDLRAEIASAGTNGMRRLDDNVSRVTSARRWSHGEIAWEDVPQELEDQPSYSLGRWTWAIRDAGQTAGFAADGDEMSDTLEFSGFGLAAGLPPFAAELLPPASTSNETFVTETFVTNKFGSIAKAAFDSAVPGMRDLLAKTNATDISSDFATDSLVGRLANDSLGFDVRGSTLVLVDGTNDLWSCAEGSGGGVDTNTVREIVTPMLDAKLSVTGGIIRSGEDYTKEGTIHLRPTSGSDNGAEIYVGGYAYTGGTITLGCGGNTGGRVVVQGVVSELATVLISGGEDEDRVGKIVVNGTNVMDAVAEKRGRTDLAVYGPPTENQVWTWTNPETGEEVSKVLNFRRLHWEQEGYESVDFTGWIDEEGEYMFPGQPFCKIGTDDLTAMTGEVQVVNYNASTEDYRASATRVTLPTPAPSQTDALATRSYVSGRLDKVRSAVDGLDPSTATVSELINALKEALEE